MKKIKIGLIARDLSKTGGGTKSYVLNILKEFDDLLIENKKFELHVLLNEKSYLENKFFKNIFVHFVEEKNVLKFDLIEISKWIIGNKFDLIFSFKHFLLPFSKFKLCKKQGVMIYDVGYLDSTDHYGFFDSIKTRIIFNFIKKSSDFYATISEFSKKQIIEKLKINEKLILIAEPGVNVLAKVNKNEFSDKKYFLAIDNAKRKNIDKVIKSFIRISDVVDEEMYVVGKNSNINNSNLIKKYKKIKTFGFVDNKTLQELYQNSTAFIFFSSYEGFGIPILEAQANSCPVICTDIDVFLEVGKKSVFYVSKNSTFELEKAMKLFSQNSKIRHELINKGLINCKNYSWKNSSKKILDFFMKNLNK